MGVLFGNDNIFFKWEFCPKSSNIIFDYLIKVWTWYGYHIGTSLHGNIFGFWRIYSSDEIGSVTMALFNDNE